MARVRQGAVLVATCHGPRFDWEKSHLVVLVLSSLHVPWRVVSSPRDVFYCVPFGRYGSLRNRRLCLYSRRQSRKSGVDTLDIGSILHGTSLCLHKYPSMDVYSGKESGEGVNTVHHRKIGDGLVTDGAIVHTICTYRVSFTI